MAKTRLSKATFVTRGYGQVEPNHLSGQRTKQIYAQLPAASTIDVLENGQFVKYDYANGVVNFSGPGEWMLVFNEIKTYREGEGDQDFAMIKSNYAAQVYSPVDGLNPTTAQARDYSRVVTPADPFEVDSTDNPYTITQYNKPKDMPEGTTMVPRVLKTNIGDLMTTNTITGTASTITVGKKLTVNATTGILEVNASPAAGDMVWQVVKVYTMPDGQPGAKVMRIA